MSYADQQIGESFVWKHPDVFSCKRLKNGMWSVRLQNRTPWPPASHGVSPEAAYEQAKLDRVTRRLTS